VPLPSFVLTLPLHTPRPPVPVGLVRVGGVVSPPAGWSADSVTFEATKVRPLVPALT